MAKRVVKKSVERSSSKGFVWYSMRISFWAIWATMVLFYVLPEEGALQYLVSLIYIIAIPFAFVTSIVHLCVYKQKAFAIVALVLSSLMLMILIPAFMLGVMDGLKGAA